MSKDEYRELIIKISQESYNNLIMGCTQRVSDGEMIEALKNCTPLTKGYWKHGKELCKEYRGQILVDVTYADWHCSNCNYVIKGTVKPKWNYCPNCGAYMRGEET